MPANRLPPSLSKATTALGSRSIVRRNRSLSLDSNGPVTLTSDGLFGPRETTSIAAARTAGGPFKDLFEFCRHGLRHRIHPLAGGGSGHCARSPLSRSKITRFRDGSRGLTAARTPRHRRHDHPEVPQSGHDAVGELRDVLTSTLITSSRDHMTA